MEIQTPFSRPLYVMAKPASSLCNLNCRYCYYLEKNNLYKNDSPRQRFIMDDDLLERFVRDYIAAQTMPQVLFTWHGGEPLMRPLSFYKSFSCLFLQAAKINGSKWPVEGSQGGTPCPVI